jgi:hypothetical protein
MRRYACFFVCAALFNGYSLAAEPVKPDNSKQPGKKQDCTAKGGKWNWFPIGGFYFCAIKTRDAGKACSDDSECQGDCVPTEYTSKLPGLCEPVLGVPGGCPTHLVSGKIIAEPCI